MLLLTVTSCINQQCLFPKWISLWKHFNGARGWGPQDVGIKRKQYYASKLIKNTAQRFKLRKIYRYLSLYSIHTRNICKNKSFWGGIHLQRKLFLIPSKILNLGLWASGRGLGEDREGADTRKVSRWKCASWICQMITTKAIKTTSLYNF